MLGAWQSPQTIPTMDHGQDYRIIVLSTQIERAPHAPSGHAVCSSVCLSPRNLHHYQWGKGVDDVAAKLSLLFQAHPPCEIEHSTN